MRYVYTLQLSLSISLICILAVACTKLVEVPPPTDTITTEQVFETNAQAASARAGMYSRMINGLPDIFSGESVATDIFSAGAVTIYTGLSSDELYNANANNNAALYVFNTNKLTAQNNAGGTAIWNSAYKAIYDANAIIEGIAQSNSAELRDSARNILTGEARFVRALSYFYLTNLFGDLPLATTVDFNKTVTLPRASQQEIYTQILNDLNEAERLLPTTYSSINAERVYPLKWAATALRARVHLYMKDFTNAAVAASEVLSQTGLYQLEPQLTDVFLVPSREVIWQLKQSITSSALKNANPEGYTFQPNTLGAARFYLSDNLVSAFETGDKRIENWTDSIINNGITNYYPAKYKTGSTNGVVNTPATEYYVVMRLAELLLIRAEANANGPGDLPAAITDVNQIRTRAGLDTLPHSLTKDAVLAAIEKERQTELFAEWGHRWFDLKRNVRAHDVLANLPLKQPWLGDFQFLYPVPVNDIKANPAMMQNPQY